MKKGIILLIGLNLFCSFKTKFDSVCINWKEILLLKNEVKQNNFFNDYNINRVEVISGTVLKEKCIGLFYIGFLSKDKRRNIYFPFLKNGQKSVYNASLYEGQKILKDTTGIKLQLEFILSDLKDKFNAQQIDSIRSGFLYGIYTVSLIRMKGN